MRHEPVGVHRIAMESAAKLIVHAAPGHGAQGSDHHVERFLVLGSGVITKEEIVSDRAGKFRSAAKSAAARVERTAEGEESAVQNVPGNHQAAGGSELCLLAQLLEHVIAGIDDAVAILAPGLGNAVKHRGKARPAVAI